jgi:hypothetical protein
MSEPLLWEWQIDVAILFSPVSHPNHIPQPTQKAAPHHRYLMKKNISNRKRKREEIDRKKKIKYKNKTVNLQENEKDLKATWERVVWDILMFEEESASGNLPLLNTPLLDLMKTINNLIKIAII